MIKMNSKKMHVPNGLLCGYSKYCQQRNIFTLSKFSYKSNNNYYKKKLPYIKTGDKVILQYDSNKNSLSFRNANDEKLDSSITNLPKDKTFYWIVGHSFGTMSMTIVD